MSEVRRSTDSLWFGAFSISPRGRLLCGGLALAFLAFPLADLTSGRLAGVSAAVAGAALAAFAALLLRLFWVLPSIVEERHAEGSALLVAIAALAIALSIGFGDEWLGLLVYVSVVMALALPAGIALAGVFASAVAGVAIAGGVDAGLGVALQALTLGVLVVGVRRLTGLVKELEATRERVAELAVSEERLRLSRDLHDLLGHNLSLIALKSELARRLLGRDRAAAESEIRDVESVARESLQEARAAVRGLRSVSLAAELDRSREALEAAGIEAELRTGSPLPADIETLLAFAVREATTNVIRHSGARRCEVSVRHAQGLAELVVNDDGAGPASRSVEGTGLRGLAERLAEADGTLDAGPAQGGGFELIARVPLRGEAAAERSGETLARAR
ncbi:MAG: sensor histidine kinase [Solirubrobacterales bacterium]